MKRFLMFVTLILTLSVTSCISSISSIAGSAVKSSKVGNKMLIHSSPRVGDYAVYKGSSGQVKMTMKITGKSGGLYVVTSDTGIDISGQYISTLVLELHLDRGGNVKKAYVVESSGKTALQIAGKNDEEYVGVTSLSASEIKEMDVPSKVTVPAGTFRVTPLTFKSKKKGQDVRIVNLVNRGVKFGYVAAYTYNYSDGKYDKVQAMELVEQGNKR